MINNLNTLAQILQQNCSNLQWQRFTACQQQLKESHYALSNLQIVLATLRRKVGSQPLETAKNTINSEIKHWKTDELARVYCILNAQRYHQKNADTMLEQLYSQGDEYEREAILKGLLLLDPKGQKTVLAIEAARTNIATLFIAISQLNPYPACHFDEGAFNQLVLKALFLGLDISLILGLKKRLNESMSRMCFDYLRERLAANRDFHPSIWRAINPNYTKKAEVFFTEFLQDKYSQRHFDFLTLIKSQYLPESIIKIFIETEKAYFQSK